MFPFDPRTHPCYWLSEKGTPASSMPAMVARRCSDTVEVAIGEFSGHGEVTLALPTLLRMRLCYWLNNLELGASSAAAMAARQRATRRRDGGPATIGPNWPS